MQGPPEYPVAGGVENTRRTEHASALKPGDTLRKENPAVTWP